ncbi:hypothetical protein Droror1_Dr00016628 [Drosera rotundifolia]
MTTTTLFSGTRRKGGGCRLARDPWRCLFRPLHPTVHPLQLPDHHAEVQHPHPLCGGVCDPWQRVLAVGTEGPLLRSRSFDVVLWAYTYVRVVGHHGGVVGDFLARVC